MVFPPVARLGKDDRQNTDTSTMHHSADRRPDLIPAANTSAASFLPEVSSLSAPAIGYWAKFPPLRRLLMSLAVVFSTVVLGLAVGFNVTSSLGLVLFATGLVTLPLLWRRPILGVYVMMAGATALEAYSLGYPDSFTDRIPFFKPLDQTGIPVPITAAELIMIGTIVLVIIKRVGKRQKPMDLGPLFPAMAAYVVFVVYGLGRGLSQGGDLNIAIWEVRGQFYPLLMYLLVFNLVDSQGQVRRLVWIFLGAIALKGIIGTLRFIVTLGGDLSQVTVASRANSLLSHEESLLFAMFFVFTALLFLFKADKAQLKFSLFALAPVALAFLANQRRAGFLAFFLAMVVVAVMAYVILPSKRRLVTYLGIISIFVLPTYVLVFSQNEGLIAEPARAISSLYLPDERDSSSNEYRVLEGENLRRNIAKNPVLGVGYGRELEMFVPLPDLTSIFSLWAYIPHNTILWIWLRVGLIGFAAFWFMVGRSILQQAIASRQSQDTYLKMTGVVSIAMIVTWVAAGLMDMGITDFRLNILVGAFLGLSTKVALAYSKTRNTASGQGPALDYAVAINEAPGLKRKWLPAITI